MKSNSIKITALTLICVLTLCCFVLIGCDRNPVVTLDKRNGEPIETVQMQSKNYYWHYGAADFPAPSRAGYFFTGWFTDSACTQSAHGLVIDKDVTLYAGWSDKVKLTTDYELWNAPFTDLFEVTASASPRDYGSVSVTASVTAKSDFTGAESADSFQLVIRYEWLSDEKFLGEYVSDDVVAHATIWVTVTKENNYSVVDYTELVLEHNTGGIDSFTFSNHRTRAVITHISDGILQYNHSN